MCSLTVIHLEIIMGWWEIGSTANAVAVGSRNGETNVAGYGVSLNAGDSTNEIAQIGYAASGGPDASGNVKVVAKSWRGEFERRDR